MFCSKCGNKLPKESIYCNKCGAKILDENIKKINNDNIADQSYVKKKTQILENVVLVFKHIINNSKNYIKKYIIKYKSQKKEKRKKVPITVICIFIILISIMVSIGCLKGMHLLQVM